MSDARTARKATFQQIQRARLHKDALQGYDGDHVFEIRTQSTGKRAKRGPRLTVTQFERGRIK